MTGEHFCCTVCGNDSFKQDIILRTKELVYLITTEEGVVPFTHAIDKIEENQIEHINEFECANCQTLYRLNLKNGKYEVM